MSPDIKSDNFLVVGIGASAGGLEACRRFIQGLPEPCGMAFVLVVHLDPTHESLMVDLLASHTAMKVVQAAAGMRIEADHLYVIPPGVYISAAEGVLHLSKPEAPHGMRLPYDYWLKSQAKAYGARSVCVVLSGSGADGSQGLRAIKTAGGLVLVQDPAEAEYDGMPRNASETGLSDHVLKLEALRQVLISHANAWAGRPVSPETEAEPIDEQATDGPLQSIIDLLHERTQRDFRLYKRGTLRRRVERRMSMSGIGPEGMADYREKLNDDTREVEELSKDLLINVTLFFRDLKTFDYLSSQVIPDMVANHPAGRALRIWVAGCSTGEEAYSLCMAFVEAINESKRHIKLQVFASDLDPDAVSVAREGVYSDALTTDISPERLKRFFTKDGNLYRVTPELRGLVVFTVQDLLADPPFSRLDFVSCRNLLIYLSPEAQTRAMLLLHFALRKGGYMLLGSSETASHFESQFDVVSKTHRLYQCIGRASAVDVKLPLIIEDSGRVNIALATTPLPSKQAALADLCRRWVIEAYAPAVVLINSRHECLYTLGPIERFLSMPQGYPTLDLLAMAPSGLRSRLRTALARIGSKPLQPADSEDASDTSIPNIDIRSIHHEGEVYFLIGFHEAADQALSKLAGDEVGEAGQIDPLRAELKSVRRELTEALQNLESLSEDHRAINEEALSINEEYQSTNEELLTSKEELQSLNEELTALNGQLQETLELKRTAANDLQNVLYSTDVATLFLDTQLNIRLFTPATTALFRIIPTDVGRPLTDLKSLSPDENLSGDAREVLQTLLAVEREVETPKGHWFIRRIMPYRMDAKAVAGVVITYTDITERKAISRALEGAKLQSEQANLAKSRFLAAVSHDLRQPLQSLALLQGLLAKMAEGEGAEKLVKRLEGTLETMAGMLNTLLDINQFETGQIQPNKSRFVLNDLLGNLKAEFATQAESLGLDLRILPSSLYVYTDQILLEQMLRNLLSNALKYTRKGKVLMGVRHANDLARLEVYDTGIGIPRTQLDLIFEEYHQIDNAARQRSQGLGLGLSIVQRLGRILHHRVQVRSSMGRGSVFSIEIERALDVGGDKGFDADVPSGSEAMTIDQPRQAKAAILVIEDDPQVRELLCLLLENEGHEVMAVGDGLEALEAITKGTIRPRLVLADYNLPQGLNGTAVADSLRDVIGANLPVIILTGDISTTTERDIASHNCVRLNKPVKLDELMQTIDRLMPDEEDIVGLTTLISPVAGTEVPLGAALIYVIDDDAGIRDDMHNALQAEGYRVETFADGESFLGAYRPGIEACMLIDAYLPGMDGLSILQAMRKAGHDLPAIMITGLSDITTAVSAMKAGASDFLQKPISTSDLLKCLRGAFKLSRDSDQVKALQEDAVHQLSNLTPRQRQIMDMVLAGHPSKNIAVDLNISQRTVENHRATIMAKAGVKSLPALARMAVVAFGATIIGSQN